MSVPCFEFYIIFISYTKENEVIAKLVKKESSIQSEPEKVKDMEMVEFKVVFNKKKYDITFGLDDTVGALKVHLQDIISVPSTMQKIMIKGLAKDEMTLRKLGVIKGSKVGHICIYLWIKRFVAS